MRIVLFLIFVTFAFPAFAATLPFYTPDESNGMRTQPHPFEETIEAYELSYRDIPGPAPLPVLRMSVQLPLVMGLGWWFSLVLLRLQRRGRRSS